MLKRFISLQICLLVFSSLASAQVSNLPDAFGAPLKSSNDSNIEGNFYYNIEWNRGTITWQNDQQSDGVLMKFNVLTKNLEVKKDNSIWEYGSGQVKYFQYDVNLFPDVKTFTFTRASDYFPKQSGFVRVIYSVDGIALIEKTVTEKIDSAPSYGVSHSITKVIQKSKTYLVLPKEEPRQFRRTNSGIGKLVPKAKLKEYLKSNSLDISKDEDVKAIIDYLNLYY